MTKPPVLTIDTLDDRREIWHLLHRLPPRARVWFLAWCCEQVEGVMGTRPTPMKAMFATANEARSSDAADMRLTNEVYMDVMVLGHQYQLDLSAAALKLEAAIKRPESLSSFVPDASSIAGLGRPHRLGSIGTGHPLPTNCG